jgi:hypothetical protein
MAGGSRTLKLSILADVDNLRKGLNDAENNVSGFGGKLDGFASKAGLAFAAAGAAAAAYAGKLAIDGVKSAMDDEAAQAKLATTLKNVTGATAETIAAAEKHIQSMQFQYGLSDSQLRPSLDRLVRSTKDTSEAFKLQALAINISAGTGKDLETVSNALAKAHDGNIGALKKLGVSLDENIIKSKDFDAATRVLSTTFNEQANVQAETFNGKMARMGEVFGEAKESVGVFILEAIEPMVTFFVKKVVPTLEKFDDLFRIYILPILKDLVKFYDKLLKPMLDGMFQAWLLIVSAIENNKSSLESIQRLFKTFVDFVTRYILPVVGESLKNAFIILGTVIGGVVDVIGDLVSGVEKAYNLLVKLINYIKANPILQGIGGAISGLFGGGKATGGMVTGGTTYLVGEKGAELFTPSTSGFITPNGGFGGGTTININVSGAIDPISTARQISDILARAATTTGSFTNLGLSRAVGV